MQQRISGTNTPLDCRQPCVGTAQKGSGVFCRELRTLPHAKSKVFIPNLLATCFGHLSTLSPSPSTKRDFFGKKKLHDLKRLPTPLPTAGLCTKVMNLASPTTAPSAETMSNFFGTPRGCHSANVTLRCFDLRSRAKASKAVQSTRYPVRPPPRTSTGLAYPERLCIIHHSPTLSAARERRALRIGSVLSRGEGLTPPSQHICEAADIVSAPP